jgi:hypothetical protein
MKVKVSSTDGQGFAYLDGFQPRFSPNDLVVTLHDANRPLNLYVDPGNYSVECLETNPAQDVLTKKKVNGVAAGPEDADFCARPAKFSAKSCNVFFDIESRFNGTVKLDATILDGAGNVQELVYRDLGFNSTTRCLNHTALDDKWLIKAGEESGASYSEDGESNDARSILKFVVGLDGNGDAVYESNWTLNVSLKSMREQQESMMAAMGGKFQDQLGYRLIIYDKLVVEKDQEGNEIRYMLKWERL